MATPRPCRTVCTEYSDIAGHDHAGQLTVHDFVVERTREVVALYSIWHSVPRKTKVPWGLLRCCGHQCQCRLKER